jgi:hypothetical protein
MLGIVFPYYLLLISILTVGEVFFDKIYEENANLPERHDSCHEERMCPLLGFSFSVDEGSLVLKLLYNHI